MKVLKTWNKVVRAQQDKITMIDSQKRWLGVVVVQHCEIVHGEESKEMTKWKEKRKREEDIRKKAFAKQCQKLYTSRRQ